MRQIYLDYNATTPIAAAVQEAMLPFFGEHFGNPSSNHSLGRAAHEAVEDARGQVAVLLGADADEIVFTSGGTESNNLALKGILQRHSFGGDGHIIISAIEHPSIVAPTRYLERLGYDVTVVPVSGQGLVQANAVRAALRADTVLVSIMHANNEVGTLQPLKQIADICHEQQVLLHTDAAQSVGKVRTLVDELDVDLLSIAGHKVYAPKGIGALYIRRGLAIESLIHGAAHEGGLRAGTENVPYIVGLGKACSVAAKCLDENQERMLGLRDRLWNLLQSEVGGELVLHGRLAPRLPNTLSVSFPGVHGHAMLARIPELCASTGSACHSDTAAMSPTLAAMGVDSDVARGTIRLSLGWYTTEDDVDRAGSLLAGAWEGLVP
jgi:cysteine desulfurase